MTTLILELPERFRSKITADGDCWLWSAGTSPNGYGKFWHEGAMVCAHRFAWEAVNGPVPPGLELDHLCRVRRCVNPTHLEPVTRKVNIERGVGPLLLSARGRARTHCVHGHPFSGDNLWVDKNGKRHCLVCKHRRWREWDQRRKAAAS